MPEPYARTEASISGHYSGARPSPETARANAIARIRAALAQAEQRISSATNPIDRSFIPFWQNILDDGRRALALWDVAIPASTVDDAMATADIAANDLANMFSQFEGKPDCPLDALVSLATRIAQLRDEARALLGVQS